MGFWNQMGIGLRALAMVCSAVIALWLLKVIALATARMFERLLLPLERGVLQWLQDRAAARALGIDIDIIRVRRKSEFPKGH